MRCMLLALVFLVLGLAWAPNIMAQELSCTAANNVDVVPSPTTVHTGDIIQWDISIENTSHTNYDPAPPGGGFVDVASTLVADGGSALHPPLELTMAVGNAGTFTALEMPGGDGDNDGICEGTEDCDCINLDPGITKCELKPGDSNIVLMYTTAGGVSFAAGQTKLLGTLRARATTPVTENVFNVAITSIVGFFDAVAAEGVFHTNDALCNPQIHSGAQGSTSEFFPPQPCIDVNKSVDPLLSKPGDSVEYTIELCNCGDVALNSITVSDTKLGGDLVPPFPSTLAAGTVGNPNCVTNIFLHTIPQGTTQDPYVNVVTATGTPAGETTAESDVSQASVDLFFPNVTISKACDCKESDPTIGCQAGDDVDYTITVNNLSTADTPSLTCEIKDALLNVNKTVTWATSTGQVNVTNKTRTFQESDPDCLTNTATLHCTIAGFPNVINKNASCEVCKNTPTTSGGEEPFKAAVWNDSSIPGFYISPKVYQFMHPNTDYYAQCTDILFNGDPRITVPPCVPFGSAFQCPSACREVFKSKTSAIQPEVCCTSKTVDDTVIDQNFVHCPDTVTNPHPPVKTALTSKGNAGWYEWTIALPKKPVDELNIEIECGVLKPNSWALLDYESIELCAAVTGEQIGPNCTRIPGTPLLTSALPKLEVIVHPGCNNDFTPFHLTSYRNPSNYAITRATDPQCPSGFPCLNNSQSLQVLDGTVGSRIALKACLEKTILVKWPKAGEINELGEEEAALEAGDLLKVRMVIPNANTVDVYCSQYSVTIGGIGIPESLLNQRNCSCISDADCVMDQL